MTVQIPVTNPVNIETLNGVAGDQRQVTTISPRDGSAADSIGALTETAPSTDTGSSGLNGRLQRLAQNITALIAKLPAALGAGGGLKIDGSGTALPVSAASLPLPAGAATLAGQSTISAQLGSPFQAGGSIANTGFNITGTLPAFAATPTVNINGTVPISASALPLPAGAATAAGLTAIVTALGSPLQAGASFTLPTNASQETGGNLAAINTKLGGTLAVSGTFWQATQPVSGTVTANAGTNMSTAALALEGGGNLAAILAKLNAGVGVTGTFFQATQPISAASLPLPTGAATATGVAAVVTALGTPFQAGASIGNTAFTANAGTNLNTSALALETTQSAINTKLGGTIAVSGTFFQTTQPISASALPLPTGAATASAQATIAAAIAAPQTIADQYAAYETVAASQTDQVMGATGATGDYLAGVLIVPGTAAAGAVSIKDGAGSAISIFAGGGTTALPTLAPIMVPLGIFSGAGAWKISTGANVTAIGIGKFT